MRLKIRETIENYSYLYSLTEPFSKFYDVKYLGKKDKFFVFDRRMHKTKDLYQITRKVNQGGSEYTKYANYDPVKIERFSKDAPVFHKKEKELLEMMRTGYYNLFDLDSYKSDKLNPTFFYSGNVFTYTITPTISPLTTNDLVIMAYNNALDNICREENNCDEHTVTLTANDFYYNHELLVDMVNIANQNDDFLIFNSIECGSQPETYHFHLFNIGKKQNTEHGR